MHVRRVIGASSRNLRALVSRAACVSDCAVLTTRLLELICSVAHMNGGRVEGKKRINGVYLAAILRSFPSSVPFPDPDSCK